MFSLLTVYHLVGKQCRLRKAVVDWTEVTHS